MPIHYAPRSLPAPLQDLITLALNLRWSWHHGTDKLWRRIDNELWLATNRNAWLLLQQVSDQRLLQLSQDNDFLRELHEQVAAQYRYCNADTWFERAYDGDFKGTIAYFSMEFGVSESLPIYSGGLGVLAGDYLKTASDLGIPLIGIGLLYQQGYFRQALTADGEQLELYPYNDPTMLPVTPLRDNSGAWLHLEIEMPGRLLRLRTWQVTIGRCSLLLLDSNDPLNDPGDRGITSELYGGGQDLRIRQEIVLGIGGWRLLEKLGLNCCICHLNEGHAAFAILERARFFMEQHHCNFQEALWATRAGNLFTTHTPVDAGFDRFAANLFATYFRDYAQRLQLDIEQLLRLGRSEHTAHDTSFNMAFLAMHGAGAVNAVSRLHADVSKAIFAPLFPQWPHVEIPIGHITNGVHMPTWDSQAADKLWSAACGKSFWRSALEEVENEIRRIGDEPLWHLRAENRRNLVEFVRQRVARQNTGRGEIAQQHAQPNGPLDPSVLTIGIARRFTEYKRPNLLLHDPDRLLRILTNRDHPVQLVIAGKAHPRDDEGQRMIAQWYNFLQQPALKNRAVFIEDYDLIAAEQLVRGVDLWINTPRRSWEACGTSGMKVLVNGGLNVSELDGWWAEAYTPEAGWALSGDVHSPSTNKEQTDACEALQLYELLENEIVPDFYQRDEHGLPRAWIARIRESMARYTVRYSSNRMAREYMDRYYAPLNARYQQRNSRAAASDLAQWQNAIEQAWQHIFFGNVDWALSDGRWHCNAQIYLGAIASDDVSVELFAEGENRSAALRVTMTRGTALSDAENAFNFTGIVDDSRPVTDYTVRILPAHAEIGVPLEMNLIVWHH